MRSASDNAIVEISLDRLSATRDRPLFSPSRRPPAPAPIAIRTEEPVPEPLPEPSPPGVTLFGTVVGRQGARAFIATGTGDQIIRVQPGDDISGWTVTEITQRNLVLSRAEQSATFTLFSPGKVSQTRRTDAAGSNTHAKRSSDAPRVRVRIR
jgi:general secretion pathway protein N